MQAFLSQPVCHSRPFVILFPPPPLLLFLPLRQVDTVAALGLEPRLVADYSGYAADYFRCCGGWGQCLAGAGPSWTLLESVQQVGNWDQLVITCRVCGR